MKNLTLIFILFPFMLAAQGKITESNYRIYSVARGKEITLKDIVADMADRDVLFFGEEHNDSVTHYLEKTMLEMLYAKYGNNITLSMEMFDRDVQNIMNEYLQGFIREKNFLKDARVWNNYRDYRPMIEFAKEKGLDVICANAPSRYANLAGRKGQNALTALPWESREYFAPVPYDTATGEYYEKLTGVSHNPGSASDTGKKAAPPMMGMPGFNMVMAQSLWDATMAYSISRYIKKHKSKKVMQVNGKFHSDEGFAAVAQLSNYSPKTNILIISTATDEDFPNIKWDDYKKQGDYVIITDPKVPRTYKD